MKQLLLFQIPFPIFGVKSTTSTSKTYPQLIGWDYYVTVVSVCKGISCLSKMQYFDRFFDVLFAKNF